MMIFAPQSSALELTHNLLVLCQISKAVKLIITLLNYLLRFELFFNYIIVIIHKFYFLVLGLIYTFALIIICINVGYFLIIIF